MSANDAIVERLDMIIAVLRLVYQAELENARTRILGDPVNRELLSRASDWMGAGKLQASVGKQTGAATRTVRDRIADLVSQGLLEKRGGGPTTEYRSSGLI